MADERIPGVSNEINVDPLPRRAQIQNSSESLNQGWVAGVRVISPTPVQSAERDLNLPLRALCAFGGDLRENSIRDTEESK